MAKVLASEVYWLIGAADQYLLMVDNQHPNFNKWVIVSWSVHEILNLKILNYIKNEC